MKQPVSIVALGSVSALGDTPEKIWQSYKRQVHLLQYQSLSNQNAWVGAISQEIWNVVSELRKQDDNYASLDPSVLLAMVASRKAVEQAKWTTDANFGVNIGSSRGATQLFEKYYDDFSKAGTAATLSSPNTTLGNIASWVANDLRSKGPVISHSITCSTALHALLNGVAWLQSGMTSKFLVGGSEAALTPFTIAQMRAMKIYSTADADADFPCLAGSSSKTKNTMIIGEAAAMACLEAGYQENALAVIEGVGYATEPLTHAVSISTDAQCFQRSMRMALGEIPPEDVDVIVMHAPGTIKGDASELKAIEKVFCNKIPALTTNKWKVGHTFGASGMLSVELAVLMLQHQECIPVPFTPQQKLPKRIRRVLVNAVGFGGNAVSVLIRAPFLT